MADLPLDKFREMMRDPKRLRNVAVVGERGHGTTALIQALVQQLNHVENSIETKEMLMTPMVYNDHLIQFINTPGTLEEVMEINAALLLVNGVVLVVDPLHGVGLFVETAIQKAIQLRKKIVLVINKLDERSLTYEACVEVVEAVNTVIHEMCDRLRLPRKAWEVDPVIGNVVFGSTSEGWGATLAHMASSAATYCRVDTDNVMDRLWDGCYYDAVDSRKLRSEDNDESTLQRLFDFVLPAVGQDTQNSSAVQWFVAEVVLKAIVDHVPSPNESVPFISRDGVDDEWVNAIRHCDANGPLVIHVVKAVQRADDSFVGIGRILAGTLVANQSVSAISSRLYDDKYFSRLYPTDPLRFQVETTRVSTIGLRLSAPFGLDGYELCAGSLCAFSVDTGMISPSVLSTAEPNVVAESAFFRQIADMFLPKDVFRVTLEPHEHADAIRILLEMRRLFQTDLSIEFYVEGSGVIVLAAVTEHGLRRAIANLEQCNIRFKVSEPFVGYQETITAPSSCTLMVKSPNKHMRLYCTAEPLSDAFMQDWALKQCSSEEYVTYHGWSTHDANRIVADASDHIGPNVLVDQSHVSMPVLYQHVLYQPMRRGMHFGTGMGVLCEEPVVGMRLNVVDMMLSHGERHWKEGQGIATARKAVLACQLASAPAILEPVLTVEIRWLPEEDSPLFVEKTIADRRGQIIRRDTTRSKLCAVIPACETLGLEETLRQKLQEVSIQSILTKFEPIKGDPLDTTTPAGAAVRSLRQCKGMESEIMSLDKLVPP